MANKKLTEEEITRRLVEGRNYKHLYTELKVRFDEVATEHKQCPKLLAEQQTAIDTLKIQVAELQAMVFGKKQKPPTGTGAVSDVAGTQPTPPRMPASYRRPIPPAHAVTSEVVIPLPDYCTCGGAFEANNSTLHERYEEDIPLPELTPGYQPHLVTKYVIERGVCTSCGKHTSGKDLGGAQVTLGLNVRLLVTHLVSLGGMTYQQVASLLLALYGLSVSDGEVANMLRHQHQVWYPAYEQLKADIRAAPVKHSDETPWAIQNLEGQGYAWVLADSNSPKVAYALENSRGARHAKELLGEASDHPSVGVRISDDYGPYRSSSLPGQQQLCWAHLYRAIRDLRYNENLPDKQLSYVTQWNESFAAIYEDLRLYLTEPYDEVVRQAQSDELWQRVQSLAGMSARMEPAKFTNLKAQLQRAGQAKLFTCLMKDTPCDNNRAERDLRQLVLKRKRSFGSKTERGAKILATVLSICTTTWRSNPAGYFATLASAG